MYTEQRTYSLEGAVSVLDRRVADLERAQERLADVTRLSDAAADVGALIVLISNPKAAQARLDALQKAAAEVEAGKAQLEAAKVANERANAESNADIERRRALVLEREIDVRRRAEALAMREASRGTALDPFPFDPNFRPGSMGPGGITRERHLDD